jgi:hypothetical protein
MEMTKEPTEALMLRAPVEFWQRLDRWCEQTAKREEMTVAPSRPASIRWIVHQFLLKQEQQAKRQRQAKRRGK